MAKFVPQQQILFSESGESIGSFGAYPCVIVIIQSCGTTILGHIDAMTDFSIIKTILEKHKETFCDSKKPSLYFTSGDKSRENKLLRDKLKEFFSGFIKTEPLIIDSTQVLVDKGEIITDFPVSIFPDVERSLDELKEDLMSSIQEFKKNVGKHKERVKGQDGLDEYGRPPAPKDANNYAFSYTYGKWLLYK